METGSWGTHEYLAEEINNAQASVVKVTGGSGVTLSDRYVLTAAHVVLNDDNVKWDSSVTNIWGESSGISNVWYDTKRDIAVMELSNPFENYFGASIADSESASDDTVFAVGHPFNVAAAGLGWAVGFGESYGYYDYDNFFSAHKVDIAPGFSGGGMFNNTGELIGIISGTNNLNFQDGEAISTPYYIEGKNIINEIADINSGHTAITVNLDTINNFIQEYTLPVVEGGNSVLPENLPDLPKEQFVSADDLRRIENVMDKGIDAAVSVHLSASPETLSGTGVLISPDIILTNAHVTMDLEKVHVGFNGGEMICGTTFSIHETQDMAIIKLEQPAPENYTPTILAPSGITDEEVAYAVGHPGYLWSSEGGWHVSALKGLYDDKGDYHLTGSTQPGSSGSAIYDLDGRLASVVWGSGYTSEHGSQIDRQDPHGSPYYPSAQPENGTSTVISVDFPTFEEFVSRYTNGGRDGSSYIHSTAIDTQDRTYFVGRNTIDGDNHILLGRLDHSGELDTSFGSDGVMSLSAAHILANNTDGDAFVNGVDVELDSSGAILVLSNLFLNDKPQMAITRITENHAVDTSFGDSGSVSSRFDQESFIAKDIAVQQDGKIVVVGDSTNNDNSDIMVARYTSEGALDTIFADNGFKIIDIEGLGDYAEKALIRDDGSIVIGGYANLPSSVENDFLLIQLDSGGELDTSFGNNGIVKTSVGEKEHILDIALQPDGKVVAGGFSLDWTYNFALARYNHDGSLDSGFGDDGIAVIEDNAVNNYLEDLAILDNGDIFAFGRGYSGEGWDRSNGGDFDYLAYRLNPDGSVDNAFGENGLRYLDSGYDDYGSSVAVQSDGDIVLSGYSHIDSKSIFNTGMIDSSGDVLVDLKGGLKGKAIEGEDEGDNLKGTDGNDTINAYGGDDIIEPGKGRDIINGGNGKDTLRLDNPLSNFTIMQDGDNLVIADKVNGEDSYTLIDIERAEFNDYVLNFTIQDKAKNIDESDLVRLEELYIAFFNRIPEADGLEFWISELGSGRSIPEIAEQFYSAGVQYSDVTGYSPAMSSDDFIHTVYRNVLGRDEADQGGLTHWNRELAEGRATRGSLADDILNAAHTYKDDPEWGWVVSLLENKAEVATRLAVEWGLNSKTPEEAISQGMDIAAQVSPESIAEAIALTGIPEGNIDVGVFF